jgi:Rod binding domain-containing protein
VSLPAVAAASSMFGSSAVSRFSDLMSMSKAADRIGSAEAGGPAELKKLSKAAGEFESMLLESLWKSMKETFSDPDDPDSDPTLKSFDDWGIQAMAGAVGSAGGLGIKALIMKSLGSTIPMGEPQAGT